jgi:hypothetical protein
MKRVFLSLRFGLISLLVFSALLLVYGKFFSGDVLQLQRSPDGKTIAEIRNYSTAATDAFQTSIELRHAMSPFRESVLFGSNYGAEFSLEWRDSSNLIVKCTGCQHLNLSLRKDNWDNVAIHYEAP